MFLISEHQSDEISLITEKNANGQKDTFIEGVFLQTNLKNRNGRVYPMDIMENEVKRYNKEFISKNRAYGELGHPEGPTINLERVSHMITSLEKDGNNFVGKAKIMNTPMGNIVKGLLMMVLNWAFPVGVWGQYPRKTMHNMSRKISCLQLQLISWQTLLHQMLL